MTFFGVLGVVPKMCGIFAILAREGCLPHHSAFFADFMKVRPRGPDNTQQWSDGKVYLGFHRLAINDLSASGNQPMHFHPELRGTRRAASPVRSPGRHGRTDGGEPDTSTPAAQPAAGAGGDMSTPLEGTTPAQGYYLVCNGEIYNHRALETEYGFQPHSTSDCEVILHLYDHFKRQARTDAPPHSDLRDEQFGDIMRQVNNVLDGEYAFVVYDADDGVQLVSRDPYGVRALFWGRTGSTAGSVLDGASSDALFVCSELKGLDAATDVAEPFPSGHCAIIARGGRVSMLPYRATSATQLREQQALLPRGANASTTFDEARLRIRELLTAAVEKRVSNSDRGVCALLSGGLDSSLVAALACRHLVRVHGPQGAKKLETFSIGMQGSTDLAFSKVVAQHIGSTHTVIELSETAFLSAIEDTIRIIESYDTTSVRASVGNYLVAKYIREHSDCKVVLNGDYSDEVCGGYIYMKKCPSDDEFQEETFRLVNDIYFFDSLRSDRTIASQGLEARTPFSDRAFVEYVLALPASLKESKGRQEKLLLRSAFADDALLPDSVLWRNKEAFSDGVSHAENSWHRILTAMVDSQVSDDAFARRAEIFPYNTPALKETFFYRTIFAKYYKHDRVIPYYWLPRYVGGIVDPSAREIKTLYVADDAVTK